MSCLIVALLVATAQAYPPDGRTRYTVIAQALESWASEPASGQKARFNLYSVYNDGSGGVHNPFFTLNLLSNAQVWVQQQIAHPTP